MLSIPDPLEVGKLSLEDRKHKSEVESRQLELEFSNEDSKRKANLEDKKMKLQKEIEDNNESYQTPSIQNDTLMQTHFCI